MSIEPVPGHVPSEQFDLLLLGTSIRGKGRVALRDYFVAGDPAREAYGRHGVKKSQFYLNVALINKENERAKRLARFYPAEQHGGAGVQPLSDRPPLPAGTVIEFCDEQGIVIHDPGGEGRLSVDVGEHQALWWWTYDGATCVVVSLP
ncbi:PapB/FocB family fimbrial expression transcriptional regulator [Pseudomonas tritici]|uniref:PapB/FocB family fimbrial expression transcriptional regulator n=1 Tax=Pseudomonas tritici TaxID=2745518 RepID=UPI00387AF6F0